MHIFTQNSTFHSQVPEKTHMDGILLGIPEYKRCAQFAKSVAIQSENRWRIGKHGVRATIANSNSFKYFIQTINKIKTEAQVCAGYSECEECKTEREIVAKDSKARWRRKRKKNICTVNLVIN